MNSRDASKLSTYALRKEKESRDKGRAAVRAKEEIPALVEKIKSLIAAGKDKEQDTMFQITEYQLAINQLNSALFATGMSAKEVDDYISNVIGKPYTWRYGKTKHADDMTGGYSAKETPADDEFLEHYGILGMKWGIRRYQNPDGTLTALGKKHLEDGETQKAIDKWNEKKGSAIARGDKKFVEKHLDYMTNEDINKFNERLKARNTIAGLKKEAEGINSERFKNWLNTASNVVQNAGNLAENGIRLYNSVVKINNTFSSHKLKPINTNPEGEKKGETISETWENGKLTRRQRQYTDDDGNRRDVTKNYTEEKKRPETITNTYDETGKKTQSSRTYTDDSGNKVTDVHQYVPKGDGNNKGGGKKSDSGSSNSGPKDWSKEFTEYSKKQAEAIKKSEAIDAYNDDAIKKQAAAYWQDQKKKKGGKG